MLVFVVTKKVRDGLRIWLELALRSGLDIMQGLKPFLFAGFYGTAEAVP
jgi:hypothetical protein